MFEQKLHGEQKLEKEIGIWIQWANGIQKPQAIRERNSAVKLKLRHLNPDVNVSQ